MSVVDSRSRSVSWRGYLATRPPRPSGGGGFDHERTSMKGLLSLLAALILAAVGIAAIIYGETDDSPGLMLLGVCSASVGFGSAYEP